MKLTLSTYTLRWPRAIQSLSYKAEVSTVHGEAEKCVGGSRGLVSLVKTGRIGVSAANHDRK